MINAEKHITELKEKGFITIPEIYTDQETEQILLAIEQTDNDNETFNFTQHRQENE